jgi:hypothetical protein
MRPTVDEQLVGIERILESEVAPNLGAHSDEALRRAIADLRRLRRSWRNVEPFLRWDNEAVEGILGQYAALGGTDGAEPPDQALDAPAPTPSDYDALLSRNARLRYRLASVAVDIARGDDRDGAALRQGLLTYLTERSLRVERLGELT